MSITSHAATLGSKALSTVADALWPRRCAGCDRPGALLCPECERALPRIDQRWACRRCGAPYGHLVCTECDDDTWPEESVSFGLFAGTLARSIVLMKDRDDRGLALDLARLVAAAARARWEGEPDIVTWVPASRAAFIRRGFDHARDLAEAVCSETGIAPPVGTLAHRGSSRDQRSLGRRERAGNVEGRFAVAHAAASSIGGARILLVDDVLTTGATVREATRVLRDAGAREVRLATVARSW